MASRSRGRRRRADGGKGGKGGKADKAEKDNDRGNLNDEVERIDRFSVLINRMYGPEYFAARRLLHSKLQRKRMGSQNDMTLYDRIMMMRNANRVVSGASGESESKEKQEDGTQSRKSNLGRTKSTGSLESVDISHYTSNDDEKRSPTPQYTRSTPFRQTGSDHNLTRQRREDTAKVRQRSQSVSTITDQNPEHGPYISKLQPGYTTVPQILSTNKNHVNYIYLQRSKSDPDLSSNKSDTGQQETRPVSPGDLRHRVRKKRSEPSPNELNLAQKVLLQRRVLAYFESVDDKVTENIL